MAETPAKTILIADDSPSILSLLGTVCGKAGYTVLKAKDGREALKLAFENDVTAIVADNEMPHLSGQELFRILKLDPEKNHIPRIMISGHSALSETPASHFADVFLDKNADLKDEVLETLKKLA